METIQDLQNALLNTTKLLSNNAVSEAKYTYTIKCTVIGIENASLNLYTVEYGANTFNAYGGAGVSYKENDIVYVLIPEGDFSQEKQIIGAVAPKASIYVSKDSSDFYISKTENLFGKIDQINLKSWEDTIKNINIDINYFNSIFTNYLEEDIRNFKFTAQIKTEIDKDHQIKGNYGLILNLPFIEQSINGNGEENQIWRSYVMDVSTIEGNPYDFNVWNKVDLYYNIDTNLNYDISRTPTITAFVNGFGYVDNRNDIDYDIHIKDIGIEMVDVLSETEAQGYYLSIVPSTGIYFLRDKYENIKTLTPVLKVKGKTDSNLKKWECYWFVEDTSVGIEHENYLNIGGLGWKCINKKTNVTYDSTGKQAFQYVTNDYFLTVESTEVISSLRYKCALVQDGIIVSGSVKLKNLNSSIELELISATGSNNFVADTGYVNLISRLYYPGVTDTTTSGMLITTAWQRFDKTDNYIDSDFYEIVRNNDPVEIVLATGNIKKVWETEIKYPCTKIEQINTVNCTFYATSTVNENIVQSNLGTASIVVSTSKDFTYGLVIEGGDVLYKYDSDGDSPLVANYDGPATSRVKACSPISFKIYKADGSQLTDIEYLYCHYTWSFPKNSMMKLIGYTNEQLNNLPQDDNYYYIIGYGQNSINYTILNTFNKKKNENVIILNVEFAGAQLTGTTSPKFLKEGESGTNGTKYSAIIKYENYDYGEKDANGKVRKLQLVYINGVGWKIYDIENEILIDFNNPQLSIEVYADGDLITNINSYSVKWSMFDNEGGYSNINETCFTIDSNLGILGISKNWTDATKEYTNIIVAEVNVQKENNNAISSEIIYAYYPIEITRIKDNSYTGKIPSLIGGFEEVVYASDGTNPSYDSSDPFECVDSLYNDTTKYYQYTWSASDNLKLSTVVDKPWQKKITPISKFDNGISKNYVKVILGISSSEINELNNKIDEVDIASKEVSNYINYYINVKQNLFGFLENFKYDINEQVAYSCYSKYINQLDESKNLLLYRGQGLQIIDNLYSILENIYNFCVSNKIKNFDYETLYTTCKNNLNYIEELLYNLIYSKDLSDLQDTGIMSINLSEDIKDNNDIVIFNILKSLIDEWNSQITYKYYPQCYHKLIKKDSNQEYIYQNQINNLHELSEKILKIPKDNHLDYLIQSHYGINSIQDFVNIKSQLEILIKEFNFNESNNSLKYYTNIVDNILKKIDNILDIYLNINYQNQYFNKVLNNLQNNLITYNNQKDGYEKALLPNSTNYIIHIKPIIMLFNRYELSHLNGWDGNKLYIDGNNQYVLAPQVGAGKKDGNTFTGVLMGVKKFNSSSNQQIGLFGFSKGAQSIFLNSEDGSATFGVYKKGQIIIEPTSNKAIIKSGNYSAGRYKGEGMQIDLTTPEIRFGTGNFVVNADGEITAAGGGTIAGWKIDDIKIYSNITPADGRLTIDSGATFNGYDSNGNKIYSYSHGKIYSGNHGTLTSTVDGFYLDKEGLSIGKNFTIWASGKAEVTHTDSNLGQWKITGEGDNQKLASNSNGILLDAPHSRVILGGSTGEIYSGLHTVLNSVNKGFYLSNNGLSIGSKVYIDSEGVMRLGTGAVANTGKHWTINGDFSNSYILYGTKGTNNSVYIGTSEIHLGSKLQLFATGALQGGTDDNKKWDITSAGTATFRELIAEKSGSIGGWKIESSRLYSDKIELKKNGSIKQTDGKWEISQSGKASFKDIDVTGGKITIGNASIDTSGNAVFNNITCNNIWDFGSGSAKWSNTGFSFGMGTSGTIANSGFNLAGSGTSWGTTGAFSGGGAASYGSSLETPFKDKCITHIETLCVGKINANYISSQIATLEKVSMKSLSLSGSAVISGSLNVGDIQFSGKISGGSFPILENYALKSHSHSEYAKTGKKSGFCSITIDGKSYSGTCSIEI